MIESERTMRARLGIVSMLDQFLDTPHPLIQREAIARQMHTSVVKLESLMANATSGHPATVLMSRLNLTLTMAGSGPKVKR